MVRSRTRDASLKASPAADGETVRVAYAAAMPPFGPQLTDEQIAAVVNHERTAWGNAAPTVGPADVAAVRNGGSTP